MERKKLRVNAGKSKVMKWSGHVNVGRMDARRQYIQYSEAGRREDFDIHSPVMGMPGGGSMVANTMSLTFPPLWRKCYIQWGEDENTCTH